MKYNEWSWDEKFITKQETVDYQHRNLFSVINDLIRACNMSEEPNGLLVEVALDELIKYAGYHFREEEGIMIKNKYIHFEDHAREHQNFVTAMISLKSRFDQGENVAHELITFMEKWLVNHILTRDKEAMKHCL